MSSPQSAGRNTGRHLDQGELADEIAGVAAPAVAEHIGSCRDCSVRLSALTTASASVARDLRADPEPQLPPSVAARFAEAIAAESAVRQARSLVVPAPTVSAPDRPPVRSTSRREGWWARHTRLGGALVTAAALVVVGGGGTVVANWAGDRASNNQATTGVEGMSGAQEDAATPRGDDLGLVPGPLTAAASPAALHRSAFVDEVVALQDAGTSTAGKLAPAQATCAHAALGGTDLQTATLTALSGVFTLDRTRVVVLVAAHDGTRTAVAISGCSSTRPRLAARGDLP